jgi:hypothetical protein
LAEIACGDFSGHRTFPAGKKRGFCQLRWLDSFIGRKSPAAISADIVLFPPAKSVVFASCAGWIRSLGRNRLRRFQPIVKEPAHEMCFTLCG